MEPFRGFTAGTSTPVPDQFFDELLPLLGLAEMRVLLFLIRCTFGSRRPVAEISLRQMMEGVTDAEGYPLAPGVGMSKATLCRALAGLRKRNVIIAERRRSEDQGNEPTQYRLNMGFF
ncbi:MAG: replication protein [Armatimonadetes bacterium]|nr:replication protein [Armatimonadota bacterium]